MDNLKKKSDWLNHIDKLIFIFASLYLIGALAWFEKYQKNSNILSSTQNQTTESVSNSDELIRENETNQNSLNRQIKATSPSNNQNPTKLTLNTTIPLPVLENISHQSTSVQSSTMLSAIPQNNQSPESTSLPQPSVTPQNVSTTKNQEAQQITLPPPPSTPPTSSLVEKLVSPPKKVTAPPQLTKVPTLQTLNQNAAPKSQSTNSQSSPSEQVQRQNLGIEEDKTNFNYNLIGIVELADNKSFALFNRNNSKMTERVQVGSEIGTSGWVLMSLNGQEVMINRFNESVYLRVGEKF